MLISEINPFIRYASITNFRPYDGYGYANDCRMFFVLSGKCRLDIDEKTYYLTTHSLAMIPPRIRYKFSEFEGVEMGVFNFDLDQSRSRVRHTYKLRESPQGKPLHLRDFSGFEGPIVLDRFERAEEYVRGIAEEHTKRKLFYGERASGLMKILICDIFRRTSVGENSSSEKIEKIISYIAENPEKELTGEALGAKFGYHPYYLSRLIKLHTGNTLKQYVISVRIGAAKNLLKSTDLSLSDIAIRCGFENAAYFSNAFKAKTKMTPGKYRREKTEYI